MPRKDVLFGSTAGAVKGAARRKPKVRPKRQVTKAQVQREVQRLKKRPVKAETRDILANARPMDRRKLQREAPTRTLKVKVRGKQRTLTADTGDILKGQKVPKAKERSLLQKIQRQAELELTGKGSIAKAVGTVATKGVGISSGPNIGGLGARAAGGKPRTATVLGPSKYKLKDAGITGRAIQDLINLPAVAVPSVYVPLSGVVEHAAGKPKKLRQFRKDIVAHDPLYALATGKPKKAAKLASEHPGFAGLEVLGAKGAAGVTAGAAVRSSGRVVRGTGRKTGNLALQAKGERIRQIGAVETRPSASVPGTALTRKRAYSRDISNKAVQVAVDKRRTAKAAQLREEARTLQNVDDKLALRKLENANRIDPLVMTSGQLRARENLRESLSENLRAEAVGAVSEQVKAALAPVAREKGAAPVLVTSGVTKASVADLAKYRDELAQAHTALKDPGKRAANVRLRRAINESVKAAGKRNDPQLRTVLAAAKEYSAKIDKPLDKLLAEAGLLPAGRAEMAKLIPSAARERGATVSEGLGLNIQGRKVSLAEAKEIAKATREVEPSYVSQAASAGRPIAYYRAASREPQISSKARTEKPTIEGTFDASPEMLRARAMNARGLVSAADNFRGFISETAFRDKDGVAKTDLTRSQAESLATSIRQESGHSFRPVAVKPWAVTAEQARAIADAVDKGIDFDPRVLDTFRQSLNSALEGKGDGPFALVPEASAKQVAQHLKVLDPTGFGKGARALRSSFSRTVLTTSPGPTFGNIVEPALRSALARAGPVSTYRGIRTMRELKKLSPQQHRELVAAIGRGQVTLAAKKRYVDPQQFDPGFVRSAVSAFQAAKRAPVGRQLTAAWDAWTHLVFDHVNGRVEAFFKQGPMLGRALKQAGLMDSTVLGLSKRAMEDAARGLKGTPAHEAMAIKLADMYGKYQSFSPSGRKVIAEYTPFAAWWLSSATFVGKVMPRDHPAMTAFTAAAASATEEWRLAQGLDLFKGKNKLPGWLQGTIDTGGKIGRIKLAYNTPAGAFTDPLHSMASMVFPQGTSIIEAFKGRDWKGKELQNEDGSKYTDDQKAIYALWELAKSTTPAVAIPTKLEHYVKKPEALLNPVRIPPYRPKAKATGGGGVDWGTVDFGQGLQDTTGTDWGSVTYGP